METNLVSPICSRSFLSLCLSLNSTQYKFIFRNIYGFFSLQIVQLRLVAIAVDADGSPVTVSWSGDARRNIIVWMDHRAAKQAERINSSNSPVLQYCGGALSLEMQPPKVQCSCRLTVQYLAVSVCIFHPFVCRPLWL
ncbi:hypothetical protein IFM89_006630 [Coptis chinensis]|uniref:FGGY carbohydrate kinase domain-containing protein n=1 Tax=Coptis chinensis TaxID=261450 RepID=A0A835HL44_9MAGN|nr:hypothetical protein IFM89_006630 [Coptis chinensis]